jgi:histone acetyltransferase (RNA polymerase elongator complex component)
VISGTKLEEWYQAGEYQPLSLDKAVAWVKELLPMFETAGVEVTRVGLHSSTGLLSGKDLVAGPFHLSLRELAMTEVWWDRLEEITKDQTGEKCEIWVHPSQYNFAIGYYGKNRKKLLKQFRDVIFGKKLGLGINELQVEMSSHAP